MDEDVHQFEEQRGLFQDIGAGGMWLDHLWALLVLHPEVLLPDQLRPVQNAENDLDDRAELDEKFQEVHLLMHLIAPLHDLLELADQFLDPAAFLRAQQLIEADDVVLKLGIVEFAMLCLSDLNQVLLKVNLLVFLLEVVRG